jgi:acyl carrier protein
MTPADVKPTIRRLLETHGRLGAKAAALSDTQDLAAAGLTSFASVQLMLGLEEAFDIEFPERMLNKRSFASIATIEACLNEILPNQAAA